MMSLPALDYEMAMVFSISKIYMLAVNRIVVIKAFSKRMSLGSEQDGL